jgi:D-alanyl-D-alanine carboxypeptidase
MDVLNRRRLAVLSCVAALCSLFVPGVAGASGSNTNSALRTALERLVSSPHGPPGAIAVVQHGDTPISIAAGTAVVGASKQQPLAGDHIRVASVAKAFSGAAALSLVAGHTLALDDTIGKWLPSLPEAWHVVTLSELLNHTSGIPDFSACPSFHAAVAAAPQTPPPPPQLLSYVTTPPCYNPAKPLEFKPGTEYRYSNSDNVIIALMIEAASHESYSTVLSRRVAQPLGLSETSLPSSARMPEPYLHGYVTSAPAGPEDVSQELAAGWAWASGGVVSTPADANRFVRGYAKGATTDAATRAKQFHFVKGSSEPPGPGTNAAGLAIFRYRTVCGTVYGHTGNTLGYTQFIAASANGRNSVSVTVNSQITPKTSPVLFSQLREIFTLGVCAATHN